ncbi:N-acetyltransferase family protein [Primorskyibacter sp. S87]|uniref:GNAT family N-acetyltransferase n=1 Tax=Primorskyibacter sp. S87 TaxID=3415126 RepID=UPI003C79E7EE
MNVTLRPARSTDAGKIGDILHRFNTDAEWMPDLHTGAETIAFCGKMIDRGWVTIAEADGRVAGFLARDKGEICALYLNPGVVGQGIGVLLLNSAKAESETLTLRTFEENRGAQKFYLREGFVETGRSAGESNDENLSDVAYIWRKEKEKTNDTGPGSD